MAILYSNIPLTKETSADTILHLFTGNDESFSVIDKTQETYENKKLLYRDFAFVKKPLNEYQVQLTRPTLMDGLTLGLYVAEGFDFIIHTTKEPIFKIEKHNINFNLKEFYNPKEQINKMMIGLFFPGTTIKYKIKGIPYKDTLTESGWKTKNIFNSVSDVASNSEQNNPSTDNLIEKAKELLKTGEITQSLFERYKIFLLGYDESIKNDKIILNALTQEEVKLLREKGL